MSENDAERLVQALRATAAYPHPVTSVELLETHISWVLLAGEYAYKVKKPVNLGFVDFTSLERRLRFCEEELRLNSRLAPNLYLDVLPITGTIDAPQIGGNGAAVEYCVRMRRFDQNLLMSRLVEEGRLLKEHVDNLADEVAAFHDRIPIAESSSRFGKPCLLAEAMRANFQALDGVSDAGLHKKIAQLYVWSEAELQRCWERLAARKEQGFVRECHGDMHLGNMILDGDKVTVFDCIEFNDELRWIDVMSEIAFCAMDLAHRGHPDLSHRYLNRCLEHSGDYAGLHVLPLYLVYRAMVRAKVARLSRNHSSQTLESANVALRGYVDLAAGYSRGTAPFLAITHGVSGSGKSFGAALLLERTGAIRVRSDVERKRLAGMAVTQRAADTRPELYSEQSTRSTYERLAELAREIVTAGYPVIVDATFLKRVDRAQFRALAAQLAVPFVILDFPASPQLCRLRIEERARAAKDPSDADLHVLEQQLQSAEPLDSSERQCAVDAQSVGNAELYIAKTNSQPIDL